MNLYIFLDIIIFYIYFYHYCISMRIINKSSSNQEQKHDKIKDKIRIIKGYQQNDRQKIEYNEVQYIMANKRIKLNLITIYLQQIYAKEYQNINLNWKNMLNDQKIISDFNKIKEKYVSQQWIEENVNDQKLKEKEQKYKNYYSPLKTKQQTKKRVKLIQDQMKILENKIIMARQQSQNVLLIKKYSQLKEEQYFFKNKEKKLKNLKKSKQLNLSISKSTDKMQNIYERISQIQKEQSKIKDIQSKRYNLGQRRSNNNKKYKHFVDKLDLLQKMFNSYCKKEINEKILFQKIQQNQKHLSLHNYLRLLSENQIDNLLTLEQKVKLFKIQSKFSKRISFLQFSNVLKSLCEKQCQKLGIDFTPDNLQNFLNEIIKKINLNRIKIFSSLQNKGIESFKAPIISKYHFKVKSHTGKFQEDIQALLTQKNQLKIKKIETSCNNLSSSQIKRGKFNKKAVNNKSRDYYSEMANKDQSPQNMSISINAQPQISKLFRAYERPTYVEMFIRKKKINLQKIKSKKQQQSEDESIKSSLITPNFNIIKIRNSISEQQQQQEVNDLKDIIEQDEIDPFLTSHLSQKYSYDSSNVKRS